jgi:hypothetical protein
MRFCFATKFAFGAFVLKGAKFLSNQFRREGAMGHGTEAN